MLEHIDKFGPTPRRVGVLSREQPTYVGVKILKANVHHNEGQHKARNGQADKANNRGDVIANRIAFNGRIYANGQRQCPCKNNGRHRNNNGQGQAVANNVEYRPAPFEGHAKVAAHNQSHPLEILDVDRLIETILDAQRLRLRFCHLVPRK